LGEVNSGTKPNFFRLSLIHFLESSIFNNDWVSFLE
jgi:hypothetical protein